MRVVTEAGEQLGVLDTRDAIQRARAQGLDLVEVSPNANPPVCKIIDYGKFQYEAKKRANEQKKKQVTVTVKEVKFRPSVDDHDYGYRIKHAREWLGEGDKVRAAIAFRGREMAHRELGAKILKRLTEDLSDIADIEVAPKMEGYQMFLILSPKKAKIIAKPVDTKPARPPRPEDIEAKLEAKAAKAEAYRLANAEKIKNEGAAKSEAPQQPEAAETETANAETANAETSSADDNVSQPSEQS